MIYQLEKHIADTLIEFFNSFDFIDKVVIFGSRAKHTANPKSDIDLCIYSLEMSDEEFSKLRFEIDELPILYKLDIVHFEKVNKELQDNVERDGKLLFKKFVKLISISKPKQYKTISKNNLLDNGDYDVYGANGIIGKCNSYTHEYETLMITCRGATCGSLNISKPKSYINGNAMALDNLSQKISLKYLYYNLYARKLNDAISGSAQPQITKENLEKVYIYLPTLTKQKKIASTLDKASELITLRKESIKKLDELSKSIFIDMFGDPFSNPKEWDTKKLGKITDVKTGKTPSRQEKKYWENGTEYWATTTEVNKKNIYDTEEKITKHAVEKCKLNIYEINTILIAMYGQGKTRGNVALLKIKSAINQAFGAILPSDDINYLFLFNLLKNSYSQIRSLGRGGNQENLNLDIVKNIEIILPPEKLQTKFANIIEKIEEQKALYEKELKLLEDNFNSLLQKSFS